MKKTTFLLLFLIFGLLWGCSSKSHNIHDFLSYPKGEKVKFKVLTLNTWAGGHAYQGGLYLIESILKESNADIIALQEDAGIIHYLAKKLGYHSVDLKNGKGILSRFPIVDIHEENYATGILIDFGNKREAFIFSVHLPSADYAPYLACFNKLSKEKIEKIETSRRGEKIKSILSQSFRDFIREKRYYPIIVMGDFNTPSHLDWDKSSDKKDCTKGILFPATKIMEENLFVDLYRSLHPDVEQNKGHTWSPITKQYSKNPSQKEPQDRIDYIFYRGLPLKGKNSGILIRKDISKWPTDHAGVWGEFEIL